MTFQMREKAPLASVDRAPSTSGHPVFSTLFAEEVVFFPIYVSVSSVKNQVALAV
jgi:hypothetical protein